MLNEQRVPLFIKFLQRIPFKKLKNLSKNCKLRFSAIFPWTGIISNTFEGFWKNLHRSITNLYSFKTLYGVCKSHTPIRSYKRKSNVPFFWCTLYCIIMMIINLDMIQKVFNTSFATVDIMNDEKNGVPFLCERRLAYYYFGDCLEVLTNSIVSRMMFHDDGLLFFPCLYPIPSQDASACAGTGERTVNNFPLLLLFVSRRSEVIDDNLKILELQTTARRNAYSKSHPSFKIGCGSSGGSRGG